MTSTDQEIPAIWSEFLSQEPDLKPSELLRMVSDYVGECPSYVAEVMARKGLFP